MTKEEIRRAILDLDYDYLMKNETNEICKQKVIDLYFDFKYDKYYKKKILNPKEEYEYLLKEAKTYNIDIDDNELRKVFL